MTSPRVPLPGPDGRLKDKHLPSRLEKTALDQTYVRGAGVTFTQSAAPDLSALASGTEYVWNKTDGNGTLLDILSGKKA